MEIVFRQFMNKIYENLKKKGELNRKDIIKYNL